MFKFPKQILEGKFLILTVLLIITGIVIVVDLVDDGRLTQRVDKCSCKCPECKYSTSK